MSQQRRRGVKSRRKPVWSKKIGRNRNRLLPSDCSIVEHPTGENENPLLLYCAHEASATLSIPGSGPVLREVDQNSGCG